jgi:hypothetical protein
MAGAALGGAARAGDLSPAERDAALAKVRAVGLKGAGHAAAVPAARQLAAADAADLLPILSAMHGTSEIATNWLSGIAEAAAQRSAERGERLPQADLEKFLLDTRQSPRARRLAYELVERIDPAAKDRLIPQMLDDPSLELRRDAVARQLEVAEQTDANDKVAAYEIAFHAARDLDQIKQAAEKLKSLGQVVDVPQHMGFVIGWHLLAPFDNIADRGWDVAYPPEQKVDLSATYDGQKGKIGWKTHTTADEYGVVDLHQALGKHMGAVAYAYAEFDSPRAQDVELRLGSVNAVKLWLNGQLLDERHVYHSGMEVDQYVSRGKLTAGKNAILLKICQNEQTDRWAQDWKFQLRVCDDIGAPILALNRPPRPKAE